MNHKVLNANGTENTDAGFIGNINPFRYRGYYYDEETNLYYLQSRYYDPTVCRFINADDVAYIAPETLNGLNLFAYCGNNPVMNVDPNGKFFWLPLLAVIGVSALTGAIDGGITAAMNGQNFWLGFAAGAIGGAVGAVIGIIFGGAISILPSIGIHANLLGRVASSAAYNIFNELFQTGTLEDMDWAIFSVDLITDALFSMLYLQWAQDVGTKIASAFSGKIFKILNEAIPSLISGSIDAVVDIFQTGTWYNKRIREKIKQGKFWVPA